MSIRFEARSTVLETAKRAALEAVADYERITPYTIGIAVQAAAAVFRSTNLPPSAHRLRDAWDVEAVEVTPRLRALESVARAARLTHLHDGANACILCEALGELDQAG